MEKRWNDLENRQIEVESTESFDLLSEPGPLEDKNEHTYHENNMTLPLLELLNVIGL